ncbi:hypothetical protein [Xanthomonas theicola]|uniref:hypothetical protein n=1 Tax=Xanthomonas theicola TaxID=56464 RepID=UPI000FF89A9C|nr:hypothetical protein [Xanthomonas theicola]QNH25383.1 hypothetical protein G4Q83_12430 [Xanthomonas theicola]
MRILSCPKRNGGRGQGEESFDAALGSSIANVVKFLSWRLLFFIGLRFCEKTLRDAKFKFFYVFGVAGCGILRPLSAMAYT